MDKATISKLKNNLSAYLRKVRAGHAVVIYDRDVPIARLERMGSERTWRRQARAAACSRRNATTSTSSLRGEVARIALDSGPSRGTRRRSAATGS